MNSVKTVFMIILAFAISITIVIFDNTKNVYYEAQDVYRIYLEGKSLGVIKSKKEFEKYINLQQNYIKQKYNVNNVYEPSNLKIEEETTYNENIVSIEEMYQRISNEQDFTIDGYIVTIKKEDKENKTTTEEKLYLLKKQVLTEGIDQTVRSFVDKDKYENYLTENQQEILDEGTIIENIYIEEEILIKKGKIPVNEMIFYDHDNISASKELTKYLLFSTLEQSKTYKCKSTDTLAKIATKNKLNIKELLAANSELSGEDALLYEGQELIISLIRPEITVVEVTHEVEKQAIKYDTVENKTNKLYVGQSKTIKKGKNGLEKVTKKVQRKNGLIVSATGVSREVLKDAVDKVVNIGTKQYYNSGTYTGEITYIAPNGAWAWPTNAGYCITEYYGAYRSYEIHNALDISCAGNTGSPIYAIQGGTITSAGMESGYGYTVRMNHGNGVTSLYAHMNSIKVRAGQVVTKKQLIGTMGSTGFSTGPHLHFATFKNGNVFDPLSLYR